VTFVDREAIRIVMEGRKKVSKLKVSVLPFIARPPVKGMPPGIEAFYVKIETDGSVWEECFGSILETMRFLRGMQSAAAMLGRHINVPAPARDALVEMETDLDGGEGSSTADPEESGPASLPDDVEAAGRGVEHGDE